MKFSKNQWLIGLSLLVILATSLKVFPIGLFSQYQNGNSDTKEIERLDILRPPQTETKPTMKMEKMQEESRSSEATKRILSFAKFGDVTFEYPVYLEYLTKMENKGCANMNPDEPYLVTGFTDCVLFCLGRNFLRIFELKIVEHDGKTKCSCGPGLQNEKNNTFNHSECEMSNFRLVFHYCFHANVRYPRITIILLFMENRS